MEIAAASKALSARGLEGLVVQNTDCGDATRLYAWAAEVGTSAERAQARLEQVRQIVKDAYIKRCNVKVGSLLALRVSAVDPSIADVPADAVNWQDEDRVSEGRQLADGRTLVIVRRYVRSPNDPLEGRRERIVLASSKGEKKVLTENCIATAHVAATAGRVAFDCAREQAADQMLHATLAFDDAGGKLAEIEHCRTPRWVGVGRVLACSEESVDADGRLKLTAKLTQLAR